MCRRHGQWWPTLHNKRDEFVDFFWKTYKWWKLGHHLLRGFFFNLLASTPCISFSLWGDESSVKYMAYFTPEHCNTAGFRPSYVDVFFENWMLSQLVTKLKAKHNNVCQVFSLGINVQVYAWCISATKTPVADSPDNNTTDSRLNCFPSIWVNIFPCPFDSYNSMVHFIGQIRFRNTKRTNGLSSWANRTTGKAFS